MKISLNWIKDYIPGFEYESIDSLTKKMVAVGLDIEGIEDESRIFEKFVVGEIVEKQKHPNADKLSVCKVNVGDKILSIVCGAPNVEKGQKVCVALEGAIIPNGKFEIKKTKLRGEESEGMICSERELNLSDEHDGILVLDHNAKAGQKFSEYIKADDIVFEIGITPNRGDLFSHFGVAREIAGAFNKKISLPEIKIVESEIPTADLIKITVDNPELCRRFTGRVIQGVEIKESPDWLKKRLASIGLRPINNIVDVTNFVMFETGQPLHAFDYDKIRGKEIIVKKAKDKDKFVTLDSKERSLNSESLMVCDSTSYSGIAGIMGGKYSEITGDTKNIFIESAYFDPVSVRRNSKRLGLVTDASQRFERGIDINMVEYGSNRASQLISELAGGNVSKDLYDVYKEKFPALEAGLRLEKTNKLIGINFTEDEIKQLLEKIEIEFLRKEDGKLVFKIPEYRRGDIEREVDLIEEVARIYGYDNLTGEKKFLISTGSLESFSKMNSKLESEIVAHLTGRGFNQVIAPSIDKEDSSNVFPGKQVRLKNSLSAGLVMLRKNLISGLLTVIKNNFNSSGKDISLKLFEIGKIFLDKGNEFNEQKHLAIVMAGKKDGELLYEGAEDIDIFGIKGEVEMFLSKLNLENFALFYYYDKKTGSLKIDIRLQDNTIGSIYRIDSSLKKETDISSEQEIYIAEFNLDLISGKSLNQKYYQEISKYPSVKRDIALIVNNDITFEQICNSITKSSGNSLKSLRLFDRYEDEKIGKGKKSLAFSMEFSSKERTLTDEETNGIIELIVNDLSKNFGAALRN